ncbi:hypothetical protein F5X96DRAFT_668826 [Biscogniauxia mediterranea]|nr:hypothetical protein F5X96DRAFT_668826 [Biscogniauxia mediterranea]
MAQASELPDHSTPSSTENNNILESNILRRKWLIKNQRYAQLIRASGKLSQTEKDPRDGEHLQGENCKAKTAELDRRIEEANARKHLEAVEENLPRICSTRRESHNEALRQSRAKQQAEPKDPWLCTTVWCKREASPDRKLCERCLLASRNQRNRRVAKELELGLRRNCGAEPRDGRTAMGNVLKDLDDGRMTSNAVPEDDQRNHQAPEPLPVAEGSTSNSFSLPLRSRNTFWDVVV